MSYLKMSVVLVPPLFQQFLRKVQKRGFWILSKISDKRLCQSIICFFSDWSYASQTITAIAQSHKGTQMSLMIVCFPGQYFFYTQFCCQGWYKNWLTIDARIYSTAYRYAGGFFCVCCFPDFSSLLCSSRYFPLQIILKEMFASGTLLSWTATGSSLRNYKRGWSTRTIPSCMSLL